MNFSCISNAILVKRVAILLGIIGLILMLWSQLGMQVDIDNPSSHTPYQIAVVLGLLEVVLLSAFYQSTSILYISMIQLVTSSTIFLCTVFLYPLIATWISMSMMMSAALLGVALIRQLIDHHGSSYRLTAELVVVIGVYRLLNTFKYSAVFNHLILPTTLLISFLSMAMILGGLVVSALSNEETEGNEQQEDIQSLSEAQNANALNISLHTIITFTLALGVIPVSELALQSVSLNMNSVMLIGLVALSSVTLLLPLYYLNLRPYRVLIGLCILMTLCLIILSILRTFAFRVSAVSTDLGDPYSEVVPKVPSLNIAHGLFFASQTTDLMYQVSCLVLVSTVICTMALLVSLIPTMVTGTQYRLRIISLHAAVIIFGLAVNRLLIPSRPQYGLTFQLLGTCFMLVVVAGLIASALMMLRSSDGLDNNSDNNGSVDGNTQVTDSDYTTRQTRIYRDPLTVSSMTPLGSSVSLLNVQEISSRRDARSAIHTTAV